MKVVAPYQCFPVEAHPESLAITTFDWCDALHMLDVSVRATYQGRVRVHALTDHETLVPVSAYRYQTQSTRLQVWLNEIRLAYLRSEDFDEDTILVSPDTLIVGDISQPFTTPMDLAMLVRPVKRFAGEWKSILNSIQWWRHASKKKLIAFYEQVIAIGQTLPEELQIWGGDTEPLRQLVEPMDLGIVRRAGLAVNMLRASDLFRSISSAEMANLVAGGRIDRPSLPILDFKYIRKPFMRPAFEQLFGEVAV